MKSLAPNTLLQNRYLVVHLIGKGGMGDVYLAVDQRLGSAVALKRTFFSDDEMFGSAFEREAKTLARLRHPVLPKVSDHFSENGVQFLIMEHIAGDDLSKRLEAAQKPFPLSWVLFWADQLLDALAYLHAYEPPIIHRDIKPQNLKLTDENSIILLDFGLSKDTHGETKPVNSSNTGSVTGYTPHYAPMEQIRGTGTNPRSDIYSLSATLYQLLTNVVPSDALTRADALLNGTEDTVKPISEINPEVPQPVSAIILKGMEVSQEKRFSNAREMQKVLRETFAQIQSSMSAQTVSFNLNNLSNERIAELSSPPNVPMPEKTDEFNIPPKANQPASSPVNYNSAAQQNSDPLNNYNSVREPNFDATIPYGSPVEDSYPKQSGIKTEVFSAGTSPLIPSVPAETSVSGKKSAEPIFSETEDYSSAEVFEHKQISEDESDYAEDVTKPLVSAEDQSHYFSKPPGDSAFYGSPQIEQEADAYATFTPTRNYSREDFSEASISQEENVRDERSDPQPLPVQKKSSGRAAVIVGGIFALFVLILGVAGAGWFIYNNYFPAAVVENPTPSPIPTIEFSPTPMPTVETVFETNTNSSNNSNLSDNTNSEVVSTNTNSQTNSVSNSSTNTVVANSKPAQPTPQTATPKPTPQIAVKNTPKTTSTPAVKPSTKPPVKKPNAPIILQ